MNNTELHELIPIHALNALEPYQVAYMEAYLNAYPEAMASYVWYLEAVTVLARAIPLEEPAQDLKARMLNRVRLVNAANNGTAQDKATPTVQMFEHQPISNVTEPPSTPSEPIIPFPTSRSRVIPNGSPRSHRSRFLPVALGTMAAAVIAGLVILDVQGTQRIARFETSELTLERLLASNQTKSAVLSTPDGQTAVGKVFVGQDGQLFISHLLPALPSSKTWQAWYILKGETGPHSLGITNASHLMTQLPANVQVVAVSEEPAGGSVVPTTVRAVATLNL